MARDGAEGLAKYNAASYDLLAVDHSLPGRDGLEIIGILASRGPLPPTIMVTGSGDETTAVETIKRGADDYIVKDVGRLARPARIGFTGFGSNARRGGVAGRPGPDV